MTKAMGHPPEGCPKQGCRMFQESHLGTHVQNKGVPMHINEDTFTILGGDKGVGTRWARRHKGAQGRLSEKVRDMYVQQLHLLIP